jgi:hypothetical protein
MSSPTHLKRGFAGVILAVSLALAIPAVVQAAPVNLATASPFVVLGGTTVTNEETSVLNGDLGVSPGTALTGFGSPSVVTGVEHAADGVASGAQSNLTTAYNVAAEQPSTLLTGNLGNRKLGPGAYSYGSAALLTGALTLDGEGDPGAEFVIQVGSQLTTASGSSVVLENGASPCNVYWQVGSSAVLGTTTAFAGNLMALTSISLNNGVVVNGRMLARNGQVSLINDVLTRPVCGAGSPPPPAVEPPGGPGSPGAPGGPGAVPPGAPGTTGPGGGSVVSPNRIVPSSQKGRKTTRNGRATVRSAPREACTSGFRATVSGRMIKRVAFSLDGKPMGSRTNSPFAMSVRATPGAHQVSARVTFTDATQAKTMTLPYRACAAALLQPHRGPSQFTG